MSTRRRRSAGEGSCRPLLETSRGDWTEGCPSIANTKTLTQWWDRPSETPWGKDCDSRWSYCHIQLFWNDKRRKYELKAIRFIIKIHPRPPSIPAPRWADARLRSCIWGNLRVLKILWRTECLLASYRSRIIYRTRNPCNGWPVIQEGYLARSLRRWPRTAPVSLSLYREGLLAWSDLT